MRSRRREEAAARGARGQWAASEVGGGERVGVERELLKVLLDVVRCEEEA